VIVIQYSIHVHYAHTNNDNPALHVAKLIRVGMVTMITVLSGVIRVRVWVTMFG